MAESTQLKLVSTASAAIAATVVGLSIPSNQTEPGLSEYQTRCAQAIAFFVTQIPLIEQGRYYITFGEAFRPQSVAAAYAKAGLGISNSLHTKRLAIDLNLFDRGVFVTDGSGHKPLAELWMKTGGAFGITPAAGYYFNDGNHYSCAWKGVK